jgi:peptidoglycan/xylan/chitin deacetylase (PgdA/CDA1 family)
MLLIFLASIAALAFGLWFWWACSVPTSTFFRPVLIRGPEQGKRICLTFDDGPASPFTERILEILREYQVPATFFVCGKNVENHPETIRRIVADGHLLGNHTYSHPFLYFKGRRKIAEEVDRAQQVIEAVAGYRPKVFRPPYGARWFGLVPVLLERGMHVVLWSATGYDWKKDAPGIVAATMRELKPGAIILLHDGREARPTAQIDRSLTVEALPAIIEGARQKGYTFASLQEFLPSA